MPAPTQRRDDRLRRRGRARIGATVLAGVTAAGVGVLVALAPAAVAVDATGQAPVAALATATLTTSDERTIYVDQTTDLPQKNATVVVHGRGFDPRNQPTLQVGICLVDGNAPVSMASCLGGEIPGKNGTNEWGVVAKEQRQSPPAFARWKLGRFDLTLTSVSAANDDGSVDCANNPCAVYVRSEKDGDRSEDFSTPIYFAGAKVTPTPTPTTTTSSSTSSNTTTATSTSTSTTSTSTSTTTSTSSSEPTTPPTPTPSSATQVTVDPLVPIPGTLKPGATQEIVFERFKPNETVKVTLFSDPISLPDAKANDVGNVTIKLTVPKDLPPGGHTLQAIGTESGTVGVAQFQVAAVATTSSSPSPTPSSTPPTTSIAVSSTPSEASSTEAMSEASSAAPTTTASSVAPAGNDSGTNLLWLWITLAAVVIIGIVVAIVAVRRHNREEAEEELALQEAQLAAAAAAERNRQQPPPDDSPTRVLGQGPYGPPPSPDGYGLLSGRDNDYPPMPPAVAGAPTEVGTAPGSADQSTQSVRPAAPDQPVTGRHSIPDDHDQPAAPATGPLPVVPAGDDSGPSTQAWAPDFTGEQPHPRLTDPPAPGGGQSSPDLDDDAGPST